VDSIDGSFVNVKFRDDPTGHAQKFTKSSVRRVLQPPLEDEARVLTKLGLVGTIKDYNPDARIVKIHVLGQDVEIDKCLICEVLPEPPAPSPTKPQPPTKVVVK